MELGLFILILAMAFVFTFVGMRQTMNAAPYFKIIAVAMWMLLAVTTGSGEGVAATSIVTDGTESWNSTKVYIPEGTDGYWISYIFSGLAIYNLITYVKESWKA